MIIIENIKMIDLRIDIREISFLLIDWNLKIILTSAIIKKLEKMKKNWPNICIVLKKLN